MDKGLESLDIAELVEQHYALVYRFAYRLSGSSSDAEDLTQQTFLTAQRKLDQVRDASKAKSWLCTIVRNAYYKSLRSLRSQVVIPLDAVSEYLKTEDPPFDFDSDDLQSALDELPDEFRLPVILFYFQEFSYREIAEQLSIPIGTVMSRLARGKAQLRCKLVQVDEAPEVVSSAVSQTS